MPEKGQLGLPVVSISDVDGGGFDCLILGLPFDLHTVTQPGSRYGSQFLHECQPYFDWHNDDGLLSGLYCHRQRRLLFDKVRAADLGDLDVKDLTPDRVPQFIADVERYAATLAAKSNLPIFIGGDHSLTHPLFGGVSSLREVEFIIQLDAHSDADPFFDCKKSPLKHNNFISHILNDHPTIKIIQIGVRDLSLPPISHESRLLQIHPASLDEILSRISTLLEGRVKPSAYLSIDVDVLDPAHFMHVSAPLSGGYSFSDLEKVVEGLSNLFRFEALDIMEICPNAAATRQSGMFLNYTIARIISAVLAK